MTPDSNSLRTAFRSSYRCSRWRFAKEPENNHGQRPVAGAHGHNARDAVYARACGQVVRDAIVAFTALNVGALALKAASAGSRAAGGDIIAVDGDPAAKSERPRPALVRPFGSWRSSGTKRSTADIQGRLGRLNRQPTVVRLAKSGNSVEIVDGCSHQPPNGG